MDIKNLQEQYTQIAKIIPAIETTANIEKVVGFYTYKIEQEGKNEKLEQWIEYLNEKNTLYAVAAINKLKKTSEEEKKILIDLILTKIKSLPENPLKWQVLMIALLNLKLYDQASYLYKYINYILQPENKEKLRLLDKEKSLLRLDEISKEYIEYAKEYMELEKIDIETVYEELVQIVDNYLSYIKEKKEKTKILLKQLHNYLKEKKDLYDSEGHIIDELYITANKEDDFKIPFWDLKKIRNYTIKHENEIEDSIEIIETLDNIFQKIKEISKEKEKEKKSAKRAYKEKLKQLVPSVFYNNNLDAVHLNVFNYKITDSLLRNSNYDLIFKYIKILLDYDSYSKKDMRVWRFKLAPKQSNKEILEKIVNTFIEKDNLCGGLLFLEEISTKRLLDFLPEKSASYYIEQLKGNDDFNTFNLQKRLFCEGKNKNDKESLKEWLKDIESFTENSTELVMHEILVILEMKKCDPNVFDYDEDIKIKLKELANYCKQNSIKIRKRKIYELIIDISNDILYSEDTIQEKVDKIKQIEGINPFKYDEEEVFLPHFEKTYEYNTLKVKSKLAFKKILEKISEDNLNSCVYLYMNTNVKYSIPIEKLFEMFNNIGYKNLGEYFKDYWFYGIITNLTNKPGYRIEFLNVINSDRFKIKTDKYNSFVANQKYKCVIKEFDFLKSEIKFNQIILQDEDNAEILKQYKQYYTNEDEKVLENISDNFLENHLEEIIELQINLMDTINSTIHRLIKDKVNPYRYYNYDDVLNECQRIGSKNFLDKIKHLKEYTIGLKDKYYTKVKEISKKYMNKNDISKIIIFYMNTFIKYIVEFDEFYADLQLCYTEKEKNLLVRYLKKYDIIFEKCKEDNIANNTLQIISNNIKIDGSKSKMNVGDFLGFYSGRINKIEKETAFIGEIIYVDIKKNSNAFINLLNVFDKFLKTNDMEYINKLKELDQIPEFSNYNNLRYVYENEMLNDYKSKYIEIVSKLIQNINDLILFINCLGLNNGYKYIEIFNNYVGQNDLEKKLKNIFLKMCKTEDLDKMIFIYQNTFFKTIIDLDDLFKMLPRFNLQRENIVNKDGIIDIEDYNFKVYGNIKKIKDESGLFIQLGFKYVKFKIDNVEDGDLVNMNALTLYQYNIIDNVIIARLDKLNSEEVKYINYQIDLFKNIFDNNYSVEEVYSIITDPYMINLNIYYPEFVKKEFIKPFNNKYYSRKIETKALENCFCKWIETKLNENKQKKKIKKIIEIYDKTVLRYIIPLGKFCGIIKNYITYQIDLKCDIKILRENKFEKLYYMNFLRYRYNCYSEINNLDSLKDIEITENKKFRVNIKDYNIKTDVFLIDIIKDEEV